MTVLEAIHEFDTLTPNSYSQDQKVRWLDRLDSFIRSEILRRYPLQKVDLVGLGDVNRQLLMGTPYEEAYVLWLQSKVHYFNEETDRYNGAVRRFRACFEDYQRSLARENQPEHPGTFRF